LDADSGRYIHRCIDDRCPSPLDRRRPFILLLSAGIVAGLLLVPRGARLGVELGDRPAASATCEVRDITAGGPAQKRAAVAGKNYRDADVGGTT